MTRQSTVMAEKVVLNGVVCTGQIVRKNMDFLQDPVPKIENGSRPPIHTQLSSVGL